MRNKKLLPPIIMNGLSVLLVFLGTIFSIVGINFMGVEGKLTPKVYNLFQYFTFDSNLLLAIVALIIMIFEILLYVQKIDKIPLVVIILKHVGTVGVALTFIVTAVYLTPILGDKWLLLYVNSNLFFHLVVPLLAIVSLVFFEKTKDMKFYVSFLGVSPMILYAVFYTINCLTHINEDGIVPSQYDFYSFTTTGVEYFPIVLVIMISLTYLISFLLWLFNRLSLKKS